MCSGRNLKYFPQLLRNYLKYLMIKCSNEKCNQVYSYEEIDKHQNSCLHKNRIENNDDNFSITNSFDKIEVAENLENSEILPYQSSKFEKINDSIDNDLPECNNNSFDFIGEDSLNNNKKCECKIKNLQVMEKFVCMDIEKTKVIKNLTKRVENLEQICEILIGKVKDLTEFKSKSSKSEIIRNSNFNSIYKLSNNNSSKVIRARNPSNFEFCGLVKVLLLYLYLMYVIIVKYLHV